MAVPSRNKIAMLCSRKLRNPGSKCRGITNPNSKAEGGGDISLVEYHKSYYFYRLKTPPLAVPTEGDVTPIITPVQMWTNQGKRTNLSPRSFLQHTANLRWCKRWFGLLHHSLMLLFNIMVPVKLKLQQQSLPNVNLF